ncbi:hypothetical protein EJ110_NYTH43890 [Nymphaea thermarum]|nr:hypothetical protein EJ110_NYTH43890 [Nymphaea thermarum]
MEEGRPEIEKRESRRNRENSLKDEDQDGKIVPSVNSFNLKPGVAKGWGRCWHGPIAEIPSQIVTVWGSAEVYGRQDGVSDKAGLPAVARVVVAGREVDGVKRKGHQVERRLRAAREDEEAPLRTKRAAAARGDRGKRQYARPCPKNKNWPAVVLGIQVLVSRLHSFGDVANMCPRRFSQKAELLEVCWLQIQGTFDTGILDKDATYSLLYFFKHNDRSSGLENGAEVSLSQKDGKTICKRQVHLKPGSSDFIKQDGEEWLAIEAGTFQPSGITREISFNLLDGSSNWKSGLVFAGVEIREVKSDLEWSQKAASEDMGPF